MIRESLGDLESFTVVSDRQKGLLSAVAEVFPSAVHRFCLQHIMGNITRSEISLSTDERACICKMARSDCENDFTLYRAELARTRASAADYLDKIDQCHWVKFKYQERFNLPTYDEITSNLSEQANSWIGNKCRSSRPLDAFCIYFVKLAKLVSERRQELAGWLLLADDTNLVPVMKKRADQLRIASTACEYTACMEGAYNVRYLGAASGSFIHPWRLVNLPGQTCTCGNWQDTEFPCVHAMHAAIQDGVSIGSLYDANRFSLAHFQATYHFKFLPWPNDVTLDRDLTIRPPYVQVETRELGIRGQKPGPKPKHKRKTAKPKAVGN